MPKYNSTKANAQGSPDVLVAPLTSRTDTIAALKEIAEQWCDLVGEEPTITTLNAFMMGAKIAISNKGWIRPYKEDIINDCGDANEY